MVAVVVPSPAWSEVLEATSRTNLRAHVLELVLKLNLLGDGDAVLGDARRAERFVQHHIAAFGAESYAHRVGENVDPVHHFVTSVDRKFHFLGSHVVLLKV